MIKDIIYKFVDIPDICKQIIDTPEFNRLRRLKQLGLAHYVFPSANHTRFEHCIGVCYITGKSVDVINKYQDNLISEKEKELLQIAGLVHDLGHVATCHLMDYILEENSIEDSKGDSKDENDSNFIHHEDRSILLLKKINDRKKLLTEDEIVTIGKMIKGDNKNTDKPYLFEIVSNKEFGLDVDRLDYLQRDLTYCGMPCFQSEYIIQCMRVRDGHLSILRKAEAELVMMYEARKRLLLLVCRHKAVIKVEAIMRKAIKKIGITSNWFLNNWEKLDDSRLHCLIEDNCPELLTKIYERDWISDNIENRLQHITLVSRDDIDKQIEKVIWF